MCAPPAARVGPTSGLRRRAILTLFLLAGLLTSGTARAKPSECRTAEDCLARFAKASAASKTRERAHAEEAARRFLDLAQDPVSPLAALLGHKNKRVQEAAARTLGTLGPRARPAFQALAAAVDRGVRGAAAALAELGDPAAIPYIAEAIRRRQAEPQLLARFGSVGAATFATLAGDPNAAVVAKTRRRMGQDARVSIASLRALAGNPSQPSQARRVALESLCGQGAVSPETAALVVSLQGDPDPTLRYAVEGCLMRIGDPDALERALRENPSTYRYGRASALKWIASVGPVASPVASTVQDIFEHGRWFERPAAAHALGRIGARRAIPALVPALASNNWRLSTAAAEALGLLDDGTSAALPALRALAATHWLPLARETAARAVQAIESAAPATPAAVASPDTGWQQDGPPAWSDPCDSRAGWDVRLGPDDGEWQRLDRADTHALDVSAAALPPAFLRRAKLRDARLPLVAVAGGWIVGTDRGELGGDLQFVAPSGESRVLWPRNVTHAVRLGDSIVALSGLHHELADQGTVLRVRGPGATDSDWFAEPVAELPGYPERAVILAADRLLVLTRHGVVLVDGQGAIRPIECRSRVRDLQEVLQKLLDDPRIAGRVPGAGLEPTRWLFFPGERDAEVFFRAGPDGDGMATLHRDDTGWRVLTVDTRPK